MFWADHIPSQFTAEAKNAAQALGKTDNILIAAHVNPDGDALGSMAAAGFLLERLGKRFALYSPGRLPAYLKDLKLPGKLYRNLAEIPFAIHAVLALDCSEKSRLDTELAANLDNWPVINVDHHICEHGLGTLANFIDPKAAATCQLIAYLAMSLEESPNGSLGDAIGFGLLTDTDIFCHGNTTAAVFSLAATLEDQGVILPAIAEKLRSGLSIARFRLWGKLYERIELCHNGEIAFCEVALQDFAETGAKVEDVEGLAEEMRRIKNVRIAAVLREINADKCKFSLRSVASSNVQAMAAALGGGGHKNAAGGTINAPLPQAKEELLQTLAKAQA